MTTVPQHPLWRELAEFMGERFRPEWCNDGEAKAYEELTHYADVDAFYRETDVLCYQSTAYFLHGWKRPYVALLMELGRGPWSILDYGCGAGHDGIWFLEQGYEVGFVDIPSVSLAFCAWRLQRRGFAAPVFPITGPISVPFANIVWCMDVVEHLPPEHQPALLDRLGKLGNLVIVNLIEDRKADGKIHYPVDRLALSRHVDEQYGEALIKDVYQMADGNISRALMYGRGIRKQANGDVSIDLHGEG